MRYLALILAALFVATPALADSYNIQQTDKGTVWTQKDGISVPVGDSGLVVRVSDFATAMTMFVVTHKKGAIEKVYAVRDTAADSNSNASTLTISIGDGSSATFTPISSGATITTVTTHAGADASVTPTFGLAVNEVAQGDVIAVYTNGGETCGSACAGTVTIVIK